MIKIKKNISPDLPICKMVCDGDLSDDLNKYELTKFLNKHSMNLIIGRPGSGKSSLLWSLFKSTGKNKILKGVYSSIYVFQPAQSQQSMKDNIFSVLPDDQKFNELTYDDLNYVSERIKADSEQGFTSCIIFDDMGAYLKNKDTLKLFKELAFNRRHLKLSMFFLVQTWYSVLKDIRRLWSNIFVFKVSKDELKNIFDEVVEEKKEIASEVSKTVYDKPYNYLFINIDSGRLFKNFDELIISS
jgi:AAA15 family ATPase/GTPase